MKRQNNRVLNTAAHVLLLSHLFISCSSKHPQEIYITCDAGDEKESPVGEMNQLLQFGAACNVFYLFSLDTDQLTGPQVMIS